MKRTRLERIPLHSCATCKTIPRNLEDIPFPKVWDTSNRKKHRRCFRGCHLRTRPPGHLPPDPAAGS
jgi:hypothetical protein